MDVSKVLAWLRLAGIECSCCSIDVFDGSGRGVVATKDISCGEVVVHVPDESVLMPENCSCSEALEDAGLTNASGDAEMESIGLILALMTEKKLGKSSKWKGYLDFLPKSIPGMPLFWDSEQLQSLEGTSLIEKMNGCKAMPDRPLEPPCKVDEKFNSVVLPFLQSNAHLKLPHNAASTRRLYVWATAMVSAYSFTIGEDRFQAMVPMWDALNHITGHANVRLHHCARKGALRMIATCLITKGEQVINSYGDLPNSELLRRYGFVETDPNPHDCLEVAFVDLHRSCHAWRTGSNSTGQHSPLEPQQLPGSARSDAKAVDIRNIGLGGRETDTCQTDRHREGCGGRHARCRASCEAHKGQAGKQRCSEGVCCERLAFLMKQGLVPPDGWFKVGWCGRPPAELLEAARLLLLPDQELNDFVRKVEQWRPPQVRPTASDVPEGLLEFLRQFCAGVVQRCERGDALVSQIFCRTTVNGSDGLSPRELASVVLRGELQCARRFKEHLDMLAAETLLKQCSSLWKHIRNGVMQ